MSIENVRQALTGKERDKNQYVQLKAGDLLDVCKSAKEGTPIVQDLHLGSSVHDRDKEVFIKVDDAFHLLDQQATG